MTRNMGRTDRSARLAVATLLLVLVFGLGVPGGGLMGWLAVIVAVIMAVTAFAGHCPLYRVFGLRTCGLNQ